jgi:hypothetical protein
VSDSIVVPRRDSSFPLAAFGFSIPRMCDRSHHGHRGDHDCAGPTARAFDRRSRPLSLTQIGELHVERRWRLLCGSYGRVHSRADQRLFRSRKSQNFILSGLQLVLGSFSTSSSFSLFSKKFLNLEALSLLQNL